MDFFGSKLDVGERFSGIYQLNKFLLAKSDEFHWGKEPQMSKPRASEREE